MGLFHLEPKLLDFSHLTTFKWRMRRIFVGVLLYFYYTYAAVFFFSVAVPSKGPLFLTLAATGSGSNIPSLIVMVTFGFIGGVFSITRTFTLTTQKTIAGRAVRHDLPVVWYMTRPLQSALMAIFIYYAFRAGQLVFYSMKGMPKEEEINVYTLSLLAIVTGAFLEEAFRKLHSIAEAVFKIKEKA